MFKKFELGQIGQMNQLSQNVMKKYLSDIGVIISNNLKLKFKTQ